MDELYLILKPEVRGFLDDLEKILLEDGFKTLSRYSIDDWSNLAKNLYAPQMGADQDFAVIFNAYLWLVQYLFGNKAALFILEKNGDNDIIEQFKRLNQTKIKFRKKLAEKDELIQISLNIGKLACFGVGSELKNWEYLHFRYIHVPDPSYNTILREIDVLQKAGVFDNKIGDSEWLLMKALGILIKPFCVMYG